ncbi:MAG TPA: OmpA family protein [Kofleriaceae bacterium]|nr:OmpA family protein [Kofleriaceae bacterium]
MHAPRADACGVKLTVKSSSPRKAVARTSNPSDILLLGNPPRRLEIDLAAAGHRVEVAPNAAAAKKKSYALVITDAKQQDEARSTFTGSTVVVRSGDVVADIRTVEQQVGRKPVRTDEGRTVVAAQARPAPIAAGPAQPERRVVAASEPKETPSEPPPGTPAQPERVAARSAPPPPAPERKPALTQVRTTATTPPAESDERLATKPAMVHDEVYFALGHSNLSAAAARPLARAVRWLNQSKDLHVVVEGHADPTGSPEGNMVLGQKRADRVHDYLISAGIDESRIEVISYGDTRLRYGRTDGRNRRAAIVAK